MSFRSLIVFFDIFKGFFRSSFDVTQVRISQSVFNIKSCVSFPDCQAILETFLTIQQNFVCIPIQNFSSDLISAYIKLINDSLCYVGLVYVSNDGNVRKKFRKSKLPHICGHQREVDNILQQFLQPIECRITIRRRGFGQINSNLQFVNQADKLHSVSIKSFPDFISISAFVQNDIRLAQIAISDFFGLNMISSRYLDHAIDHQVNIDIPLGWSSETLLSAVKRCTTEWNSISKPFLSTKYNVLNIDKIQNKHIWFKFLQTRDRFLALQQDPNEISVYHGTGGTEPSLIYTGTEGLDFRFAREGYWGRSNYFAESILLADQFSYQIP